jgi:hypothetical protein
MYLLLLRVHNADLVPAWSLVWLICFDFAINRLELTTDPQPFMVVEERLRHPRSAIILDQNDPGH